MWLRLDGGELEHGTSGIRVRVWGRLSARARGKRPGEGRGGPWGPYPRARRLGVVGIGVGRGWSDRLGRYSEVGDDPGKILHTGPWPFIFYFFRVLSLFDFLFYK